jgi:hypothetical protein
MARTDQTPLQVFYVAGAPPAARMRASREPTRKLWSLPDGEAERVLAERVAAARRPPVVPACFDVPLDQASWRELERAYDRPLVRFWRGLLRGLGLSRS